MEASYKVGHILELTHLQIHWEVEYIHLHGRSRP